MAGEMECKKSGEIKIEIVRDETHFRSLQEDWDELFERANRPRLSQSFEWCRSVWETIFKPSGARLHCVLVWRDGRLILVLPSVVVRQHSFWRACCFLGAEGEYADVLADDTSDAQQLFLHAWKKLTETCHSDFVVFKNIRSDSAAYRFLSGLIAPSDRKSSPYVSFEKYGNWEEYWRSRERTVRQNVDRRYRRLAELGSVEFHVATKGDQYRTLADWTFRQKRLWQKTNTRSKEAWLYLKSYEDFFTAGFESSTNLGGLYAFALLVGDRVIAVQLNRVDKARVECVIVARDLDFARYGAGFLLAKSSLEWACANRLEFDFLFGANEWKESLSDQVHAVADFTVIKTRWGRVNVVARSLLVKLRRSFAFPLRVIGSIRRRGVREAAIVGKQKIVRKIRKVRSFDKINGTDTEGAVSLDQLNITSGTRRHGEKYEPSSTRALTRILDRISVPYEDYTFIDFGSGKGRALLLASHYPFKKIIGLEFAPELHEVAQRNIAKYRSRQQRSVQIESLCVDAVEYEVPKSPAVYYFFNPFNDQIMRLVLTKIKESIESYPRDARFIYYNPKYAHVFEEVGIPKEQVILAEVQADDPE